MISLNRIILLLSIFSVISSHNLVVRASEMESVVAKSKDICHVSAGKYVQCDAGQKSPVFSIGFDLNDDARSVFDVNKVEDSNGRQFSVDMGGACGKQIIDIENISGESNAFGISSRGVCTSPARMCVNVGFIGTDLVFKNQLAVVRSGDYFVGIQSDQRLGTEVDQVGKKIRFCTNPVLQRDVGWSMDVFSGSESYVKSRLQSINAPIFDAQGKNVGYSKKSPLIKDAYLFVDLTEANSPSVISLAKRGNFPYVLVYSGTWASSLGTYDFNKKNYPDGIYGLQRVVKSANAEGVKIGLHTLTSFVTKSDPFVLSRPDALLKDDRASLLNRIGRNETTLLAAESIDSFPSSPAYYGIGKAGLDLLVGREIISCSVVRKGGQGAFGDCRRGLYGSEAVAHEAGTPIFHLAERYGSYLLDLRGDLKKVVASRLSSVINDAGIDMVYFDGGEVGSANGDAGWYVADQQIQVLNKVRRPILVEGSGIVPRLWPFLTRVVDDDFAALAPVSFLDEHKIGRISKAHAGIFMPDNLGWLGLLKETQAYPATTPEEISTYVARSLSLNIPLSIETHLDDLVNNPYTSKLMDILSVGNKVVRDNFLSNDQRALLGRGGWYYDPVLGPYLKSFRKISQKIYSGKGGFPSIVGGKEDDAMVLRIRKVNSISSSHPKNVVLLGGEREGVDVTPPKQINSTNRGVLISSLSFGKDVPVGGESSFVKFVDVLSGNKLIDLSSARTMAVDFDYGEISSDPACSVVNIQLQDNRGQYRDYLLPLHRGGNQHVLLDYEASAPSVISEFLPAPSSYAFKAAVYGFNYAAIKKMNIRWMRYCGENLPLRLKKVEMLREFPAKVKDVRLNVNGNRYFVAASISSDEVLDVFPDGTVQRCTGGGCVKSSILWPSGKKLSGAAISLDYVTDGSAEVSIGLLGSGIPVEN